MATIDEDLTRVLVLQDRVGERRAGHFDHDANGMSGPLGKLRPKPEAFLSTRKPTVTVEVTLRYDPVSGEHLGV